MTTIKKRATTRPAGITVYITPTCVNCPKHCTYYATTRFRTGWLTSPRTAPLTRM
jgi:hypothetical protein